MSASSFRVGRQAILQLIEHADKSYARPSSTNALRWTTDDLSDFVAGCLDGGFDVLVRLNPENVCDAHVHSRG